MTITFRDSQSAYRLAFPSQTDQDAVMALAETFIAHEQTRSPEQQTPYTPAITGWYQELVDASNEKVEAQRRRTIASHKIKQFDRESRKLVRQMWKTVTLYSEDELSEAVQWGFKLKQTTGNILMPRGREERMVTLATYFSQEESRPEAERFPKPALADVMTVRDELKANLMAYQNAETQQETSVESCRDLTKKLSSYLQAAGIFILAGEFEMKLSTQLQNWGYDVVLKRSKSSNGNGAVPADEPQPVIATNGSAPANGVAETTVLEVNGQEAVEV